MRQFTAREYLQIDIANNFGLDTLSWDDRLQWFKDNEDKLDSLLNQAKEPALFFAGVKAWRQVLKGEAIGYPISLDATASGFQILSCLTRDRKAAELCNVIDTGKRLDAYTVIYEAMMEAIGQQASLDRKQTKRAVMTSLYASEAVPREVFGEGALLELFYDTMSTRAPRVWNMNSMFKKLWNPLATHHKWILPDNFHVEIKILGTVREQVRFAGSDYEITRKVNMPQPEGRSLGANVTHSIDGMVVREMLRRCSYDVRSISRVRLALQNFHRSRPVARIYAKGDDAMVHLLWSRYEETGYLSARILDHITSDNIAITDRDVLQELVDSLPAKPFDLIAVHDCFRCLPSYGNDLRRQYINQLYLITKSNLLNNVISQIVGEPVEFEGGDEQLADDILSNCEYALS